MLARGREERVLAYEGQEEYRVMLADDLGAFPCESLMGYKKSRL